MKLDEIARLAGVSRTTASYVINGKARQYRVSDKTVEKVMAVVREHNYHPNAVAAGLRAGRTRSIGLVIPDLENTSYEFTLEDGTVITAKGNEEIEYDGELHTAANLYDALKEGYYGKF